IFDEKAWEFKSESEKTVLINFGTHVDFENQKFCRLEVEKFIGYLINIGYNIKFIPFHNRDLEIGKQLIMRFPEICILEQPKNFLEAVNIFQKSTFVIGERLHFIVMAIL